MAYIGKQPTVGNFVKLDSITTSATTTFNLLSGGVAYYPQSANHCIVSLNGVIQSPGTSFTISGSTIVFASALTATDVIDFILVLGDVLNIGTPSDATVGFAKVTSNLITGATAETSIAGGDSILIYDDSATALRKMTRTNFVSGLTNTPAFHVTQSASQNFTNNTRTKITFNTEVYDIGGGFDTTDNDFTVPTGEGGKYFFYFQTQGIFCDSDTEICSMGLFVDGSLTKETVFSKGTVNTNTSFYNTSIIDLSAGNVVDARLIHTQGTTRGNDNAAAVTYFVGFKLI